MLPADGHGDDDRLPAGVEEFSGGGDPSGYQHPQGAHRHKHRTHQRTGIVIVLCVWRREGLFISFFCYVISSIILNYGLGLGLFQVGVRQRVMYLT